MTTLTFFMIVATLFATVSAAPGLQADYYKNKNAAGDVIASEVVPTVDLFLQTGCIEPAPGVPLCNVFSINYHGYVASPVSGSVTFFITIDDGGRLTLDNQLIINQWKHQAARTYSAEYMMTAGEPLPISLQYFEAYGHSTCRLEWQLPGGERTLVPESALKTTVATVVLHPSVLSPSDFVNGVASFQVTLSQQPQAEVTILPFDISGALRYSSCELQFDRSNWDQSQTVSVSSVATWATGEASSAILFVSLSADADFDEMEKTLSVVERTQSASTCVAWGDPHYTSFDGLKFDFYGVGDFVLMQSYDASVAVQTRLEPCGSRGASCTFAAAVRLGTTTVHLSIDRDTGLPDLRIASSSIDEALRIGQNGKTYTMSLDGTDSVVKIVLGYWSGANVHYLNMYPTAAGVHHNRVTGLCGNFDGSSSNDVRADLSINQWGELFRVDQAHNLFLNPDVELELVIVPDEEQPDIVPIASLLDMSECAVPESAAIPPQEQSTQPLQAPSSTNDVDVTQLIVIKSDSSEPKVFEEYVAPEDFEPASPDLFSEDEKQQARAQCSDGIPSSVNSACVEAGVDVSSFIDSCSSDLLLSEDVAFIDDMTRALLAICSEAIHQQQASAELMVQAPSEPSSTLTALSQCPNLCSNHGECTESGCVCNEGWSGSECAIEYQEVQLTSCQQEETIARGDVVVCSGVGFTDDREVQCHFTYENGEQVVAPAIISGYWAIVCDISDRHLLGDATLSVCEMSENDCEVIYDSEFVYSIELACEDSQLGCIDASLLSGDVYASDDCMTVEIGARIDGPKDLVIEIIERDNWTYFGSVRVPLEGSDSWQYITTSVPYFDDLPLDNMFWDLFLVETGASSMTATQHTKVDMNIVAGESERQCACVSGDCMFANVLPRSFDNGPLVVSLEISCPSGELRDIHAVLMQRNTWVPYGGKIEQIECSGELQTVEVQSELYEDREVPRSDLVLNVFMVHEGEEWEHKTAGTRTAVSFERECVDAVNGCIDDWQVPRVLIENEDTVRITYSVYTTQDADLVFGVQQLYTWQYFGGTRISLEGKDEWQIVSKTVLLRDTLPSADVVVDAFLTPTGADWREKTTGVKTAVAVAALPSSGSHITLSDYQVNCEQEQTLFEYSIVFDGPPTIQSISLFVDSSWTTRSNELYTYTLPSGCSSFSIENGILTVSCHDVTDAWAGVLTLVYRGRVARSTSVAILTSKVEQHSFPVSGAFSSSEVRYASILVDQEDVSFCSASVSLENDASALAAISDCQGNIIQGECMAPERGCLNAQTVPASLSEDTANFPLSIGVYNDVDRDLVINLMQVTEQGWEWHGGYRTTVFGGSGQWNTLHADVSVYRELEVGADMRLDVYLVEPELDWRQRNTTITVPIEIVPPSPVDEVASELPSYDCTDADKGCIEIVDMPEVMRSDEAELQFNVNLLKNSNTDLVCDVLASSDLDGWRYVTGVRESISGFESQWTQKTISINLEEEEVKSHEQGYVSCYLTNSDYAGRTAHAQQLFVYRAYPSLEAGDEAIRGKCSLDTGCIDAHLVQSWIAHSGTTSVHLSTIVAEGQDKEVVVSLIRKSGAILFAQARAPLVSQGDEWQQHVLQLEYNWIPSEDMELNIYITETGKGYANASYKVTLDARVCV